MKKIRIAIIGWGNVGRYCKKAIEEALDLELVGVVRRESSLGKNADELQDVTVVSRIDDLKKVDVAVVCVPSRRAPIYVKDLLSRGISTVDSFDVHDEILKTKKTLNTAAKSGKAVSLFGAGWDPGTDSVLRSLFKVLAPQGMTTTTFGGKNGGRSMGHTAAVKAIKGVKNAVSLTFPNGLGKHKRQVYIELADGADFETVATAIRRDAYFINDPTDVVAVEDVSKFDTLNHGGRVDRITPDVMQKYEIEGNNPQMTAHVLVGGARAVYRAHKAKNYGAYTMIELPIVDFLAGDLSERLEGY